MHANEVILHEENRGTTREITHRGCIMSVIRKEVAAGGRIDLFLESAQTVEEKASLEKIWKGSPSPHTYISKCNSV